ncbi:hypothetical protein TeGR_g3645, partial [Tetraparma gracilis]
MRRPPPPLREAPPGGDEATPSAAEDPVSTTTPAKVKELALDLASGRLLENELSDPCDPDRGDEYCPLDGKTGERIRLTLEEKEKIYMDAVQSFYFSNRELLPQQEFDLLKEDLSWNGSPVISMNRREQAFLNAKRAYLAGEPSLSDEAFDGLKAELRAEKSKFAVSTEPRCYIDTGICTVTLQEDKLRDLILYLPAAAAATLVWTEVGYEFFNLFDVHFIEPPGTFRGRGEHPKMGMIKQRVAPEQVLVNFSTEAPPPRCSVPGHAWGEVRHDPNVQWLSNWKENINGQ